jgi:anti-sigma regulatory factor (Ser/Thr protein kinase)
VEAGSQSEVHVLNATATDSFVHTAMIYLDADEYVAGTIPFVQAGLDAGDAVAVAVPGPNLELIRTALGDRAADVHMIDMVEAGRNPGRIIAQLLSFAQANADRPVRIVGEPIWPGRSATEYPACVQHEALINLGFDGRAVSILCPYDGARLEADVLTDIGRTHPTVIDTGGRRDSDSYAPDRVLDAYNLPLVKPATGAVSAFMFTTQNQSQARAYTLARALRLGLPRSRADDVQLAVAELTKNSVRHGGGRGILEIWAANGDLICQVRDAGTITDSLVGRRPVAPGTSSGRGLLLVHRLADLVRTHTASGRTTTRLYFRLDPTPSQVYSGPLQPSARS